MVIPAASDEVDVREKDKCKSSSVLTVFQESLMQL